MQEIWKEIYIDRELSKYDISNLGRVRNRKRGNIFIPQEDAKGYLRVILRHKLKAYTRKVHRLVAYAFLKRPLFKKQVNHKDGDKKNNNMCNLEWATNSKNQIHAYKLGLNSQKHGELHHNNKYKESLIIRICELMSKGLSTRQIKSELNIPSTDINISYLINDIKKKGKWKHISKNYNW